MKDFYVRVLRGTDCENGASIRSGFFVSKVYAIDKKTDSFLVYDPGDVFGADWMEIPEGFTWVCFHDTLKRMDATEEGLQVEPVVTLCEGEEEQ